MPEKRRNRNPHIFQRIGAQQALLFFLLTAGLAIYFIIAWRLYATGAITGADQVRELHKAGVRLFLPYLGLAVGGVFATKRFDRAYVEAHVFVIALVVILVWDVLALGNLLLVFIERDTGDGWTVEDVVNFSEDTMQILSVLPAAAIGFYFGAQTEQTPDNQKSSAAASQTSTGDDDTGGAGH